jgi:hypothetical protein
MNDITKKNEIEEQESLIQSVTIAITCAKHVYHDPEWNRWADAWLSGEDRTEASASWAAASAAAFAAEWAARSAEWAASAASAAEWAARAASAAAFAEEWASSVASWSARAESAASAAKAAERKWQADRIREIIENPFEVTK